MKPIDFNKINELAESYKPEMTRFLREMIRLPSESCREKAVVLRIKEEMEMVGFDKVEIDPMGNILVPMYKEASYKPYIIAAMILLSKVKHPAELLNSLLEAGVSRMK